MSIIIIDADVERVTHESLLKAQEDRDLVADFSVLIRVHRETVTILNDDELCFVPRPAPASIVRRAP